MNDKPYVVVFRLTGGHTIQVNVPESQAKNYLNAWLGRTLGPVLGEVETAGPWGVKTSEIIAVQLFDSEELNRQLAPQGTRPQQPLLGPYFKSGSN